MDTVSGLKLIITLRLGETVTNSYSSLLLIWYLLCKLVLFVDKEKDRITYYFQCILFLFFYILDIIIRQIKL